MPKREKIRSGVEKICRVKVLMTGLGMKYRGKQVGAIGGPGQKRSRKRRVKKKKKDGSWKLCRNFSISNAVARHKWEGVRFIKIQRDDT